MDRRIESQAGETLDQVIRRLATLTPGRVEATLAANPGLADLGARLPEGHAIILPEAPPAISALGTIHLWD